MGTRKHLPTRSLTTEELHGTAITTTVLAGFAAVWGMNGSAALPGAARIIAIVAVITITAALLALAWAFRRAARRGAPSSNPAPNPFQQRAYWLPVIFEVIAIPVAAQILIRTGYPDAVTSAVAFIVGLHFFGLVRVFGTWRLAVTGGAMALVALLSLLAAPQATLANGAPLAPRMAVVGLGCALILWLSVLPLLVDARTALRGQASAG